MGDVSTNTVAKLLVDAGLACARFHDENVCNVSVRRVECDKFWSFCCTKQKNVKDAKAAVAGAGDVWTWTALYSDSTMILSHLIGDRDASYAHALMLDLRDRLATRLQLTTDGHKPYLEAVGRSFGPDIDYEMSFKLYGEDLETSETRCSSPSFVSARREVVSGRPNERHISTPGKVPSSFTLCIILRQPLQRRSPITLERRPVHQRDRRRLQRGQPA